MRGAPLLSHPLDLDPTNNDQLQSDLWRRLLLSVEKQMSVSEIS
jgi:hypothetical protein